VLLRSSTEAHAPQADYTSGATGGSSAGPFAVCRGGGRQDGREKRAGLIVVRQRFFDSLFFLLCENA